MLQRFQFDDAHYECIFVKKGEPVAVETIGTDKMQVRTVFLLENVDDIARAEKVLSICRDMLAVYAAKEII